MRKVGWTTTNIDGRTHNTTEGPTKRQKIMYPVRSKFGDIVNIDTHILAERNSIRLQRRLSESITLRSW